MACLKKWPTIGLQNCLTIQNKVKVLKPINQVIINCLPKIGKRIKRNEKEGQITCNQ